LPKIGEQATALLGLYERKPVLWSFWEFN
jgi:hypothetical protein